MQAISTKARGILHGPKPCEKVMIKLTGTRSQNLTCRPLNRGSCPYIFILIEIFIIASSKVT